MKLIRSFWVLHCYSKSDGVEVANYELVGVSSDDMRGILDEDGDDLLLGETGIGQEHIKTLQIHVKDEVDLDKYDYKVSLTGEYERRSRQE